MKKYLYIFAVCILSFWAALAFKWGVLRLHVIANSDSAADQAAKLAVRDAVLSYGQGMGPALSSGQAKGFILSDGAGLQRAVEQALESCGADYGAELRLGSYDFPRREYSGIPFPAGEYRALKIVLGEGAGQNWWCVLFPPLCILEGPDGQIEQEAKFDSLILKLIREARSDEHPA